MVTAVWEVCLRMENKLNIKVNIALNGTQKTTLDLIRIIAAMFVMLGHSFSYYQITVFKDQTYFPYIQNIGVVMFFLLSGFLTAFSITGKNKEHQYSFSLFFKHKAIRIAKEYIPGLALIAIIDFISILVNKDGYSYYGAFNITQFIGNALMLHNMGPNSILGRWFIPFGSGRPLWTLAVEWWLYMLYGAVYISLSNKVKLSLSKEIVFGIIVFMVCDYLITGRGNGLGFVFALGVLSYFFYELISMHTAMILFVLSCLLYIGYGIVYKEAYTVYSFIILWLVFCSAIKIGRILGTAQNLRRNSILAFVSKSTFMLYLIHYSIIDLIYTSKMNCRLCIKFFAGIIISLIISFSAFYIFGEKDAIGRLIRELEKKL